MKSISYLLGCMLLILCWACDKDSIEEQSPILKTKAESIPEGLTITKVSTHKDHNIGAPTSVYTRIDAIVYI